MWIFFFSYFNGYFTVVATPGFLTSTYLPIDFDGITFVFPLSVTQENQVNERSNEMTCEFIYLFILLFKNLFKISLTHHSKTNNSLVRSSN